MITENYIWSLLRDEHDFRKIIQRLENLNRKKEKGLEEHHIEPERVRVIYLKPLEHLAIHIAHARLEQTGSHLAKVASFVRAFPGSYRRLLNVAPDLRNALISFGQARPGQGKFLSSHPNTIAAHKSPRTQRQLAAIANTGRRTAYTNHWKSLGIPNTWGDKVSKTIRNKPLCCCLLCGRELKAIPSNIIQHQRSKKCSDSLKKAK